jgi:hypothetical protein
MYIPLKSNNLTLRYAECLGLDVAVDQWEPADPRLVDIELELNVGWSDWDNGFENTFFVRATSNDLRKRSSKKERWTIWFEEFSWIFVKAEILKRIAGCERGTWKESFAELKQRFCWYYEGSSW